MREGIIGIKRSDIPSLMVFTCDLVKALFIKRSVVMNILLSVLTQAERPQVRLTHICLTDNLPSQTNIKSPLLLH